jgi:hypothetical protein
MIDRTQLTEALARMDQLASMFVNPTKGQIRRVAEAARWARDFPTDEQVEVGAEAVWGEVYYESEKADWNEVKALIGGDGNTMYHRAVRAALEAVTMIGDNQ